MSFHTNHPARSRRHPWKRGAAYRIAVGTRIAEAKSEKDRHARAQELEREQYDLAALEAEARRPVPASNLDALRIENEERTARKRYG